jgi:hypothetical protein
MRCSSRCCCRCSRRGTGQRDSSGRPRCCSCWRCRRWSCNRSHLARCWCRTCRSRCLFRCSRCGTARQCMPPPAWSTRSRRRSWTRRRCWSSTNWPAGRCRRRSCRSRRRTRRSGSSPCCSRCRTRNTCCSSCWCVCSRTSWTCSSRRTWRSNRTSTARGSRRSRTCSWRTCPRSRSPVCTWSRCPSTTCLCRRRHSSCRCTNMLPSAPDQIPVPTPAAQGAGAASPQAAQHACRSTSCDKQVRGGNRPGVGVGGLRPPGEGKARQAKAAPGAPERRLCMRGSEARSRLAEAHQKRRARYSSSDPALGGIRVSAAPATASQSAANPAPSPPPPKASA